MSKPYHVYLDLDVVNNDTTPNQKAPQLSFEETRSQPFLDGTADDYFVAIARFSIQTGGTLPVFIPAIQTGQDDIDLTVYRITIDYNGSTGYADIRHVAQPTADNAASPMNGQDFSGDHYYVYNYSDWIQMVNTGFTAAVKDLQNKLIAASIYNSVSNQRPTPLDAFTHLATGITQVITLANSTGTAFAGPVAITTTTAPLNVVMNDGTDLKVANNGNTTTRVSNASTPPQMVLFIIPTPFLSKTSLVGPNIPLQPKPPPHRYLHPPSEPPCSRTMGGLIQ